jgi:altronate dehydratase
MRQPIPFAAAGRLPEPGDNVAIAVRRLEAGSAIADGARTYTVSHTVLEGHRFVRDPIAEGGALLSWGLPFGYALRALAPGDYVCNEKILTSLSYRQIDFALPAAPNFRDHIHTHALDERNFRPGPQVAPHPQPRTFQGYARGGRRGVGTRNFIVLLGTTSMTAAFARALEERCKGKADGLAGVDGIVAVTHTEGGQQHTPNNLDFVLRCLAGFMVHPNVGAVLAVDHGSEVINNRLLREFMARHEYPLEEVTHSFFSIAGDFQAELARAEEIVDLWLPLADGFQRTEASAAHLKLALQCGGSDAFSGVSGNPLAGWLARETIRHGGAANLAETDELIGAESYVLSNVRDLETARAFLDKVARFKERAAWHGHSAEGNPSAGNQYRGLYNIVLKSIGAARKKPADVRLDHVIDYGAPMREPGYYFMDSPGNDLESIAGQVAGGSNVILFTSGNGSITNFPFVPTLKIVTTTGRWQMLANEMDINAGRYQDGLPMDELGAESFELLLRVASGERSLGERAGHAQVQIWRDWAQTDGSRLAALQHAPQPAGQPLPVRAPNGAGAGLGADVRLRAYPTAQGFAADRVGLVVPTSLCSSQIARMIADDLNANAVAQGAVSRFVALAHTEGCGAAPGYSLQLYVQTVLGHLTHPMVRRALLLEHGCEATVNDTMRNFLTKQGVDVARLGWASVQLDGGIEKVMAKCERWFRQALAEEAPADPQETGLQHLRLGLTARGAVSEPVALALARMALAVVHAGGLVVLPDNAPLLALPAFRAALLQVPDEAVPTLGYGQRAVQAGLHIMEAPTDHAVETLTGLGATGVEAMLAHVAGPPLLAHPMIPLVQVSADDATRRRHRNDLDLAIEDGAAPDALARTLLELVARVVSRDYVPHLFAQGHTDFQLTRGWLGLSL